MTRRIAFVSILLLLAVFAANAASAAQNATETIRQAVEDVLKIIDKTNMQDPAQREAMHRAVERRVEAIFDFEEFSARTVGPKWRQFTPDQKKRFENAFAELLRRTYVAKMDDYDGGGGVKFLGEVASTKGDRVEVQSAVMVKNQEIPVAYRLFDKGGVWRVYDVRIENISLVENYRSQFKELLLKGDAEELIRKVEEKSKETQR